MFNNKIIAATLAAVAFLATSSSASAATLPSLGAASTFTVLSGSGVPNEVGMATQAQIAVLDAYSVVGRQVCETILTGAVGNTTLNPGLTCLTSTSTLNGVLTLNGMGNANSVFLLQSFSSNLTVGPSSTILSNGAIGGNLLIVSEGNVTVPANTVFVGTIIAKGNVSIDPSARIDGHVFSTNGFVTAPAGTVTCAGCVTNHPTLIINKTVINDNGGVLSADAFLLLINDMQTATGRINILAPGTYTVGELNTLGYGTPSIGGACGSTGLVTLGLGESRTCNMVNDDTGAGGVVLPNTGSGGLADMLFWNLRTLLIAAAAAGLVFVGLRAVLVKKA